MYPMKPVYDPSTALDGTSSMYRMKPIYSEEDMNCGSVNGPSNSNTNMPDAEWSALAVDQAALIKRIEVQIGRATQAEKEIPKPSLASKSASATMYSLQSLAQVASYLKEGACRLMKGGPLRRVYVDEKFCSGTLDIVVSADPRNPPYSVWVLANLIRQHKVKVGIVTVRHSSQSDAKILVPNSTLEDSRSSYQIIFTVVWKSVLSPKNCEIMVNPIKQSVLFGEINLLRYVYRVIAQNHTASPLERAVEDELLDAIHCGITHGSNAQAQREALNSIKNTLKSDYFGGKEPSLVDIALYCAIKGAKLEGFPPEVSKWYQRIDKLNWLNGI